MKGIGEFLSERLVKALPGPKSDGDGEAKSQAIAVLRDSVPPAEAEQLATSLEGFASSADFAEAVDDAVPPPRAGESEEEFVVRSKEAIRSVLMAKFGR